MDKVIREGAVRAGVDLAKRVIQVYAVGASGRVLTSRALARDKFIEWCIRLPGYPPVEWWRWRQVPALTTGPASSSASPSVEWQPVLCLGTNKSGLATKEGKPLTTLEVPVKG